MLLDDAKEAFDYHSFTQWAIRIGVGIITLIVFLAVMFP